jgi:ribosomal protein S18 acetylase RimI-like enzyme
MSTHIHVSAPLAGYRGQGGWTTEHHLVTGERISLVDLTNLVTKRPDKLFVACIGESSKDELPSDTAVVGCICAERAGGKLDENETNDSAMLGLFAVHPDYQSQGVGSALLTHATDFVQQQWHCKRIVLWVIEQRGDIISWYKRCGFQATGERLPFVMPDLALVKDMHFQILEKEL